MNNVALDQIVSKLSREQCLQILNDPRVDVVALQKAMASVVMNGGAPALGSPVALPAVAPAASVAPKAAKPSAAPKAAASATTPTGVKALDAINAIVGQGLGFSAGDVATVCGLDARDSSIRTAIKNMLGAGVLKSFGEKRFMRYGATEETAKAASLKSQGKSA